MYNKILDFIQKNGLVSPGMTVIAAVSGGADSVCLLEVLKHLEGQLGFTLECAHFNHHLRAQESDGDEEFVKSLCRNFNVPLHTGGTFVGSLCDGMSLEDAARRARYGFFERLLQERDKNTVVATAHTLNDNVETFFINLLRGSGSRGLCAVPVTRGKIIRPMLETSRDEITAHLSSVGLEWRTDSTNSDTAYLRNFLRHEILPRLASRAELDPYAAVSRAIANLRKDNAALEAAAESCDTDDTSVLRTLPDSVLWRVFTKKLEKEYDIILDSVHFNAVKSLLSRSNSQEQIRADVFAVNENGHLRFMRLSEKKPDITSLKIGENNFGSKRILIKNVKEIYNGLTKAYVDCDKIGNTLYADFRRDGDMFFCPGRAASSQLGKLLKNDKVPRSRRDSLVVIRDSAGSVVFVEGYGADSRFCADAESKKIICIEII